MSIGGCGAILRRPGSGFWKGAGASCSAWHSNSEHIRLVSLATRGISGPRRLAKGPGQGPGQGAAVWPFTWTQWLWRASGDSQRTATLHPQAMICWCKCDGSRTATQHPSAQPTSAPSLQAVHGFSCSSRQGRLGRRPVRGVRAEGGFGEQEGSGTPFEGQDLEGRPRVARQARPGRHGHVPRMRACAGWQGRREAKARDLSVSWSRVA